MKAKFFLILLVLLLGFFMTTVSAAVTLVDFNAKTVDLKVILEWETGSEIDMLYFVILRSDQENGNYNQISDFIITEGSSTSGLIYQYIDTNVLLNRTYYYKLEAVDSDYQSQLFGPVSITVRLATFTNTVTPSRTMTVTGTITPNTQTMTNTITPSPTKYLTSTKTLRPTSTSPFSFVTNTRTPSPSFTSRFSPIPTRTPITLTPEFTRTYEIISIHTHTPSSTITITPIEAKNAISFRSGVIGFGATIVVGAILLLVLVLIQKNRKT